MKKILLVSAAAAAFVSPAQAATVNFNELAHTGSFTFVNPLTSGGLQFLSDGNGGSNDALGVWGSNSSFNMDAGGAAVFHNYQGSITTVTLAGGGMFDFNSIDLGDVFNGATGGLVELTFTDAMGTTSTSVALDNMVGGQTFSFNRTGLTAFTLRGVTTQGRWLQFDNVVYNNPTGAVPEPATWAMLIVGFGMVGAGMRRRQAAVRVTYA